ncbi:phosphodiester glycosidase family protein [Anaerorhabdus furcosa]|uniref:Exopolysaccharide biosynthesis protein n=1 Tax=Anaerorhabdus furcosa TaxID=118967 RepID=A0A1T4PWY3_9FIRM|nr:phosphodiester glycosidase family protein [Anaerorhabdus furcosa]SJZ96070.1 Exopolysaccharide biosynthesis protein [Anaerorhabdus furcosa]
MSNKRTKTMSVGLVVSLCIVMILVTAGITTYLVLKETYKGSAVAYSNQLIKDLPSSGLDHTIAKFFYSDEEIKSIKNGIDESQVIVKSEEVESPDGIEIHALKGSTYQAFMMIVKNPEDLMVAVNPYLDSGAPGPSLEEYIEMYDGIAGINAGGFEDAGGKGNGGQAWGIVISEGELVSGYPSEYGPVIGINGQNQLVVGDMSAQQALDWGVRDAVTFGPIFIKQYQNVFDSARLAGLNPRTAIGQRADGSFLLLVMDGRQPLSFGALYPDIIQIMQDYGAMTAANLDGGNSTVMVYENETVNSTVSIYGARNLPTAFVVKAGE